MSWNNKYVNLTVRANTDGSRSYYEHDDRRGGFSNRRGTNLHWSRGRRGRGNGREGNPRVDDDGDVRMAMADPGADRQSRFTPYSVSQRKDGGGNRYRRDGNRGTDRRAPGGNQTSHTGWTRVIIPFGRRLHKNYVLRSIAERCSVRFTPLNYQNDGNAAIFYLEDKDAANEVAKLNRRIPTPDGQKMNIVLRGSGPPNIVLGTEVMDQMRIAICRRYSAATQTLDLSFFHLDQELKKEGLYLPLERPGIMFNTIKIVSENVGNLLVLDLTGNRLSSLNMLGDLMKKLAGLKTLLLSRNQLLKLIDMDRLKDVPLEELTLNGNPLCNAYRDHSDYVDAVRKRFPKLVKLDGAILPAQIGFELEKVLSLPTPQGSFFVNEESKNVVVQYLQQYYEIYDSHDRQGLMAAYHDDAMFSMTSFQLKTSRSSIAEYIGNSRNLLKIYDSERRNKLLKQGKLEIVTFLKSLPKTQHDPASITVDVSLASPTILSFSVCGIFKQIESKSGVQPIRSFSRAFVLVPQAAGFCIVNETLVITSATDEQVKTAFKTPAPTPSPSPVPTQVIVPATAPVPVPLGEDILRQQMVTAFAQQSGMNIKWAAKCLEDNGWDYDKAALVFTELNMHGSIPNEAFQS